MRIGDARAAGVAFGSAQAAPPANTFGRREAACPSPVNGLRWPQTGGQWHAARTGEAP
jgi:hypothetical protein